MTNKELIKQYCNTGLKISEYQFEKLSNQDKKTYLRARVIGVSTDEKYHKLDLWELDLLPEIKEKFKIQQLKRFYDVINFRDYFYNMLPNGYTVFNTDENLDFSMFRFIPDKIIFKKKCDVLFNKLIELPKNIEFYNEDIQFGETIIPDDFVFNNKGIINFDNASNLGKNVIFNNKTVWLSGLKTLPEGIQFNNTGNVGLYDLEILPENFVFDKNILNVILYNIKEIPESVIFNNQKWVKIKTTTKYPENLEDKIYFMQ